MNLLAAWSLLDVSADELAGWAVVLSGLSLVGIIWVVRLIYKLAENQVKMAAIFEDILKRLQR